MYGLLISLSFYGSLLLYCINVNANSTAIAVCSKHRAVEQLHYIISYWYNGGGSSRYFNDVIN